MQFFVVAREYITLSTGRRLDKGGSYELTEAELNEAGTRVRVTETQHRDKAVHAEGLTRAPRRRKRE